MVELIGQKEAKTFVKGRKSLPNCIIIHGPRQSGKKTLARYIAEKVGYDCIFIDNKVDSIREMIDLSSSLAEPTLFVTHISEMCHQFTLKKPFCQLIKVSNAADCLI